MPCRVRRDMREKHPAPANKCWPGPGFFCLFLRQIQPDGKFAQLLFLTVSGQPLMGSPAFCTLG